MAETSDSPNLPAYVTAGLYLLPEMMFNTLEDNKFVYNFGIEAAFYKGAVSIRTGAGLSISRGITKNEVAYNDFLGTYNKLDSITFMYNEQEHDFTPEMHTSQEKVWDSLSRYDSTEIVKRYSYLQVPFVIGFDFWKKGRLSAGVRVGTIMSVLLQSKQLTGPYDPGENRVTGIKSFTPDQVSINWMALGGICASYRLKENLFLEVEPQLRYYYQSIYEKSENLQKPWSVGIRAGISFKF